MVDAQRKCIWIRAVWYRAARVPSLKKLSLSSTSAPHQVTMHASLASHGTHHRIVCAAVPTPPSPPVSLGRHASYRRRLFREVSGGRAATRASTVCASSQLELSELTALGPLDGRYASKTASLRPFFSEYVDVAGLGLAGRLSPLASSCLFMPRALAH